MVLFEIHSLLQFLDVDPKTLRDAYVKFAGIPRRCFQALDPDGDAHEMKKIKRAIDDIDNIADFAKSASGPMPFKTKVSHLQMMPGMTESCTC